MRTRRPLSRKQIAILEKMIDAGSKSHEVADELGIDHSTCSSHLERARRKLGARTTLQAAVFFDRGRRPS